MPTGTLPESSPREILAERYSDQPVAMPAAVRDRIQEELGGPILLYGLADLDAGLKLRESWVALGHDHVAVVRDKGMDVTLITRGKIQKIREVPGLSSTTLTFIGEPDEAPFAILRYSHRQKNGVGNIVFVLQQGIDGHAIDPVDEQQADRAYLEAFTQPIADAQASVSNKHTDVMWRLLSYLKPYRKQVTIGMVAAAFLALAGMLPPMLTRYLIDDGLDSTTLARSAAWDIANYVVWGITAAYLLRLLLLWVRLRVMAILGEYVAYDLRNEVYAKVQSLSISYFSRKQTGSIISRVGSDTDRIWEFIAFGVVEVSLSAITLIVLSIVLISLDVQLGLVMVLPVPFMIWAIIANSRRMQRLFIRAWRKWSNLTDVLAGTIPGIRVVKAFNQEEFEIERFGVRNDDTLQTFNDVHRNWTRFWPILLLAIHGISIAVYWLSLPRLLPEAGAERTLTTGTLFAFLMYMGMFFQPIEVFGQMARMLNRSLSSARRIFELMDTESEIIESKDAVKLDPVRGEVEFRNILALERLIEGRTTFVIAHRLSTLKKADRILVLKDGRLAEEGTHAELLSDEDGIYRKLSDIQRIMHEAGQFGEGRV